MNAPRGVIWAEQLWANDLLHASRLYRHDAIDAGEPSIAATLDDLERSLIEIVNSPPATARRISTSFGGGSIPPPCCSKCG